jgi:hypothetical protein
LGLGCRALGDAARIAVVIFWEVALVGSWKRTAFSVFLLEIECDERLDLCLTVALGVQTKRRV